MSEDHRETRFFASTPIRQASPETSMMAIDRAQLQEDRKVILAEATQMAQFALSAMAQGTGNIYQYLSFLKPIEPSENDKIKCVGSTKSCWIRGIS